MLVFNSGKHEKIKSTQVLIQAKLRKVFSCLVQAEERGNGSNMICNCLKYVEKLAMGVNYLVNKTTVLVIITFFSFLCTEDLFAKPYEEQQLTDENDADFYLKYDSALCFDRKIIVATSCHVSIKFNQTPFCFSQNFSFLDLSRFKIRNVNYTFAIHGGNPDLIDSVYCVEFKKSEYFILQGTNYSSCDQCEWIDVYRKDGSYVGSTGQDRRDFDGKFVPLSEELGAALSTGAARQGRKISINRNLD